MSELIWSPTLTDGLARLPQAVYTEDGLVNNGELGPMEREWARNRVFPVIRDTGRTQALALLPPGTERPDGVMCFGMKSGLSRQVRAQLAEAGLPEERVYSWWISEGYLRFIS